jgi:hypothetical protein
MQSRLGLSDAVDPFDNARRSRQAFRRASPHETTGPAMRVRVCVFVMLASEEAGYVFGATIAVTGGKPII